LNILTGVKVNELKIYNRWVHLVWSSAIPSNVPYFLVWDGKANQGIRFESNALVPDGTYLYNIGIDKNDKPLIDFIAIARYIY